MRRVTKEKLELLLRLIFNAKDENNKLPKPLCFYCELVNINPDITRAMSQIGLFKGIAKQKKEILFNEVTPALIEQLYQAHIYKKARVVETKENNTDELMDIIHTMASQISFIYYEIINLKKTK